MQSPSLPPPPKQYVPRGPKRLLRKRGAVLTPRTKIQDPEAEYAAWKLRELKRIKREREAIEAREAERAEVERRRNLTEEERRAEDAAFLARQRSEREQGRGKMAYMQKYQHRDAFYRGDEEAEALAGRDIMGARFADDVQNRELLPKALQLRDMTRLGRKGASKYRDLRSEDTGRWGDHLRRDDRPGRGAASSSDFNSRRVDDRFRSDRERDRDSWYSPRERRDDRDPYSQPPSAAPDSANTEEQIGDALRRATEDYPQTSPDGDDMSMSYSGQYTPEQRRDGVIQSDPKKRKRNFSNRTKTGCLTCRKRKKK